MCLHLELSNGLLSYSALSMVKEHWNLPRFASAGHSYLSHVVWLCVAARSGIVPGAKYFVDSVPID